MPGGHGAVPHRRDEGQLEVAADQRRRGRRPARRRLERLLDEPRDHGVTLALCLDGGKGFEPEGTTRQAVALIVDDHVARRGRGLQPRRDVDDVARRERVLRRCVDRDDRLAGRDPGAHVQGDAGMPPVQLADPFEDRQRRTDRPFGVVALRERRAEHRHHRVADVLLDGPAVALDPARGARRSRAGSCRGRPRDPRRRRSRSNPPCRRTGSRRACAPRGARPRARSRTWRRTVLPPGRPSRTASRPCRILVTDRGRGPGRAPAPQGSG